MNLSSNFSAGAVQSSGVTSTASATEDSHLVTEGKDLKLKPLSPWLCFTGFEPSFHFPAVARPSSGVPQPPGLTMADHYTVTRHLRNLSKEDLIGVGGALGLYYPHLRKMSPLLEELVAAWLNKEDNVQSASGDPSWSSLIKALQDIHQPGIAMTISSGKSLLKDL